jgi:hypothetical protein
LADVSETYPGFDVIGWHTIVAPANTPRDIRNKLYDGGREGPRQEGSDRRAGRTWASTPGVHESRRARRVHSRRGQALGRDDQAGGHQAGMNTNKTKAKARCRRSRLRLGDHVPVGRRGRDPRLRGTRLRVHRHGALGDDAREPVAHDPRVRDRRARRRSCGSLRACPASIRA